MDPDFGERQYEFAVNFELTTAFGAMLVGGAPTIPTTNQEAKKGYDALFNLGTGYLYHLQYKRSTYASRRTPKNPRQWAFHGGTYYRFALLEDSKGICRQHLKLEELRRSELGVYYCAPSFHLESDFWAHASASSVFSESVLIDIAGVPLPTPAAPHAISFDTSGLVGIWSEFGESSRSDRSPDVRLTTAPEELSRSTFLRLLMNLVDALAAEASVASRVPRSDSTSGLRTSIIDVRAPRALRGEGRRRPMWHSDREATEAFQEVPEDRDRQEAAELAQELDDQELVMTAGRVAALDFGLMTVVEPA